MSNEAEADQWRVRAVEAERERDAAAQGTREALAENERLREAGAHQHEKVVRAEERAHWEREKVQQLMSQVLIAARERDEARKALDGMTEQRDALTGAFDEVHEQLEQANTRVAALERDYFRVRDERDAARDELRQEVSDGLAVAARLEEAREDAEAWRQTSLAASLRTDEMRAERDELLGQRAVQLDQAVIARLAVEERGRIDGLAKIVAEQSDAIAQLEGLLEERDEGLEQALEAERYVREDHAGLQARVERAIEKLRDRGPIGDEIIGMLEPDPPLRPENFEAMRDGIEERLDALGEAAARHYGVAESARRYGGPGPEPESLQEDEDRFTRSVRQYADREVARRVVRDFAGVSRRWGQYLDRHE